MRAPDAGLWRLHQTGQLEITLALPVCGGQGGDQRLLDTAETGIAEACTRLAVGLADHPDERPRAVPGAVQAVAAVARAGLSALLTRPAGAIRGGRYPDWAVMLPTGLPSADSRPRQALWFTGPVDMAGSAECAAT